MAEVKWLRFKVGMFDGHSFKRIKRAKIDGIVDFRDKLTAVWFELIDLAGKVNNNGFFFNDEIAYQKYDDIAIMLDRSEKEIELCVNWYIDNGMMEILNNHFLLSNFTKYQNADGLLKIQEQNRERQRKYRENKKLALIDSNVTNTLRNEEVLISNSISNSLSKEEDSKEETKRFKKPTLEQVEEYCQEHGYEIDAEKFINYHESKGWVVGKSPMKNWQAAVRTWVSNQSKFNKQESKEDKYKGLKEWAEE